jgi:hypothetical protein
MTLPLASTTWIRVKGPDANGGRSFGRDCWGKVNHGGRVGARQSL